MRLAFLIFAVALAQTARAEDAKPMTPTEVLRRARLATGANFRSAQVIGRFKSWVTMPGEAKPTLKSEGRFIGIYAEPKRRVDFEFSVNKTFDEIAAAGRGGPLRLVDAGAERPAYLSDGVVVRLFNFPDGNPRVVRIRDLDSVAEAAGFPYRDPFHLDWYPNDARSLLGKIPSPKFDVAGRGEQFVCQCNIAGKNRAIAEFIVDPALGFRVTKYTAFFGGGREVLVEHHSKWKQSSGQWFVSHISSSRFIVMVPRVKQLSVCTILSFRPNVEIDPKLFEPDALATPLEPTPLPAMDDDETDE